MYYEVEGGGENFAVREFVMRSKGLPLRASERRW